MRTGAKLFLALSLAWLGSCTQAPEPMLVENVRIREESAISAERKVQAIQSERKAIQSELETTEKKTLLMQALLDSLQGVK